MLPHRFILKSLIGKKIQKKASKSGKIIFIDAYTQWCGPCKWMSKKIFTKGEVGKFYNEHFINAKFDMEAGDGVILSEMYDIQSYPTFLFIDEDGKVLHMSTGSRDAEEFIALAHVALDPSKRLSGLRSGYNIGSKTPETLKLYAETLYDAGLEYAEVVNEYLETQDNWFLEDNSEFLFFFAKENVNDYRFQHILNNVAHYDSVIGENEVRQKLQTALYQELEEGYTREDLEKQYRFFFKEKWRPRFLENLLQEFMDGSLRTSQKEFLVLGNELAREHKTNNWVLLNNAAWAVYTTSNNEKELEDGLYWIMRSIEIKSKYSNNDTAAALYQKLGRKYEAKTHAQLAIQKAKEDGADYSSTASMLKKINEMD